MDFPIKNVISRGYVKLPEGTLLDAISCSRLCVISIPWMPETSKNDVFVLSIQSNFKDLPRLQTFHPGFSGLFGRTPIPSPSPPSRVTGPRCPYLATVPTWLPRFAGKAPSSERPWGKQQRRGLGSMEGIASGYVNRLRSGKP